jgi:4-hydroxybenzoate polyprenyltransferase
MRFPGKIAAFLKLIRWQNLLIVALTMVLMRYAILEPLLTHTPVRLYSLAGVSDHLMLQTGWFDFAMLVLATVMLTAGGYVINDYFDIQTDLINRGKVIVSTTVPRKKAMMLHNILNIIGVVSGFYVSAKIGFIWLGAIFLVVSGLLYFYSASYKRQFLIGNLIVALLTAMVPFLVVIFEGFALFQYYAVNAIQQPDLSIFYYWVGGFAFFAFITTLAREIIKDIEDFEGDNAYGRNTLPVAIGILASKITVAFLIVSIIASLVVSWKYFLFDYITLGYLSLFVVIPLLYVVIQLIRSKTARELHIASTIMKFVMVNGILYSVVVKIIISNNLV